MDGEVIRIGDNVRRRAGAWTPSVHRLLGFLADHGFEGAPRAHGTDDSGREVLTFLEGTVIWPDHFDLVESDQALHDIGALVSTLHDLTAQFEIRPEDVWRPEGRDAAGHAQVPGHAQVVCDAQVVCHNDLGPWNLLRTSTGWAFIDWDLAAPGRRGWDLALAMHTLVPLWPDSGLDDASTVRRIRALCDGYRLPGAERAAILDVAIERTQRMAHELRTRATAGQQPWVGLVDQGHLKIWSDGAQHLQRRIAAWQRHLRG